MSRRKGLIGIAALVLGVAAAVTSGQELRQLKESDIRKLIPVLRAEAAAMGAAQATFEREEAARSSFSGDPLEFLRSRAKLDLPEGARYVAGCSRAASVQTVGGPIAIFTFGRNIDCYERAWRDWKRTAKPGPDGNYPPEPKISQDCYIEHEQTQEFLKGVQAELEKRGFKFGYPGTIDEPWLFSADGIFQIRLHLYNIYDRANRLDDHPLLGIESEQAREAALAACSGMPSGPILIVSASERFFEKEPLDTLDIALQKAGLSKEEYNELKMALFMARMDTKPEWWEAAEAAAAGDPAAQRDLSTRRHNLNLYRMFAAQLDPLLDALSPQR
jgi:hypothetical protein